MVAARALRLTTISVSSLAVLIAVSTDVQCQQNQTAKEAVIEAFHELDNSLSEQLAEDPDGGAAIVIVDNEQIIWGKTYGDADGKGSRQVDMNTMFSVQSVSKTFTAVGVLMAVQDGLVDLDTPIKEYLPEFTVNSLYDEHPEDLITLRHLLAHRAGLPHEAPFGINYDDRYDFTKHIESISDAWLRYPVGYRKSYSNVGIDLAGYILQVRSGTAFEQYMREKVLDPIGMNQSSFDIEEIERRENRARGHWDKEEPLPLRVPMIPAGGLYSTASDMARFLQFHINKGVVDGRRILREDLFEELHTIQFARHVQRTGYCLGVNRGPISNSHSIYHSGGGYGFSADFCAYPELGLGIVVLWNLEHTEYAAGQQLRQKIDDCVIAINGETPVDTMRTDRMTRLGPSDPRIQAVLGHYGDPRVGELAIEGDDASVRLQYGPEQFIDIEFYDDSGALAGMVGSYTEIRFLAPFNDRRGSMYLIDRRKGNGDGLQVFDFNYLADEPAGPDKPEWSEYLGEYYVLRWGAPFEFTANITVENGYLFYNGCKCTEHEAGLFFIYDGTDLDFRSEPPTFGGIVLYRKWRQLNGNCTGAPLIEESD